jgi:hypothetical protein
MVLAAETGEPRYFYRGPDYGSSVRIPLMERIDFSFPDAIDTEELCAYRPVPCVELKFQLFSGAGWPRPQYVVLLDAGLMKLLDTQDPECLPSCLVRLP